MKRTSPTLALLFLLLAVQAREIQAQRSGTNATLTEEKGTTEASRCPMPSMDCLIPTHVRLAKAVLACVSLPDFTCCLCASQLIFLISAATFPLVLAAGLLSVVSDPNFNPLRT
ncbi:unnamed protein product [Darwinula stevensoni]|uniref:Uncharacterized protein n=1 Tax=Darwinula stevensoni TaxID=69355 RepID=A0A7R9FN57_9CRUS|nr:unnamed protein product [Darwinula stevensoni]CAG0896428.1 unnamed protein product [Darwinula stevensoni]